MDPLATYRLDPALRVTEKPGGEHEPPPRRRKTPHPEKPAAEDTGTELDHHQLDNLA